MSRTLALRAGHGFIAGPLGVVEVASGEEIQFRSPDSITGDVAFSRHSQQRSMTAASAPDAVVPPYTRVEMTPGDQVQ